MTSVSRPRVLAAAERAEDAVLVDGDHDDAVAGQSPEQVQPSARAPGPCGRRRGLDLLVDDRAVLLEAVTDSRPSGRRWRPRRRSTRARCTPCSRSSSCPWRTPHPCTSDASGLAVVGAHEGDLARRLDDVDGDGGDVIVGSTDLGRASWTDLEVQDALSALDRELLGACERLGGVELASRRRRDRRLRSSPCSLMPFETSITKGTARPARCSRSSCRLRCRGRHRSRHRG